MQKIYKTPTMVDLVVAGLVAFDDVTTPAGSVGRALGGPASYSSVAASLFCKAGMVAVAGNDFPDEYRRLIAGKGVDMTGLQIVEDRTFYWKAKYEGDMESAETLETQINALAKFKPEVPEGYKGAKYLLVSNMDPEMQLRVIEQTDAMTAIDTMDYWIEKKRDALMKTIAAADILFVNDEEAQQLTGKEDLDEAAEEMLKMGPKKVVIKLGSKGSMLFEAEGKFICGAYPIEVVDPTGCGDSFAGTVMGCLASGKDMKEAVIYGSAVASFNAEDFSLGRLKAITLADIDERCEAIRLAKL